ncbi:LysR family transcriptional regulator [Psychromonas ossibalaenae]|uniref:LysR family transcriptional regulator n=1 Tax=Psychromonas ossibalaenae TaxID=444922 RepID=UPI000363447D|nr:LysR family transcriptional regulator [Psychromonas ossibalaenae]
MEKEINLADIKTFVLIAQQGSFTKAAEILGCSRSHLSKQLNQLEAQLGVKLIARTTRSQRLTDLGKQFFDSCLTSLQGINQAVAAAVDNAQKLQGNININSVGGIIGEEIICSMINDFLKQYPDITINLDFSSQRVDLIEDEFDLVFRMGELQDSGLIARKLMDIPIDTLASPAYLQQHGYPEHPKALPDHQCITGSINHWHFFHKNDPQMQVEIPIKGAFRCKSGRAMLNSAKAGGGIIRLPRLYCTSEIDKQQLIPVFTDWEIPSTPFFLLYQQDKFQPARLRTFINFVVNNFADYTRRGEC